jgi:deoxyuridine 5'-triphosphate nucleotidohydrolase
MITDKLKVKKLTETAKLPTKAHPTDLGYDLYADETISIDGNSAIKIKTGIAVGFPEGWGGFIKDRSSMASKGFAVIGGVIDQAYIGELSIVITYKRGVTTIQKGDKIAQLVPIPLTNWPIVEVENLQPTDRGEKGFGSSGSV